MASRLLATAVGAVPKANGLKSGFRAIRRRGMAGATSHDMTLPLKGYKVLDMTRVLAGVGYTF